MLITSILFLIQTIYSNILRCNYVRKKRLAQFFFHFRNLDSNLDSEDPWTSNEVNGPKQCWNLNDRTFTIFIDRCEGNSGWKSLPEWYEKSEDCVLTHWLQITSILSLTETINSNIFHCNYLWNEKNSLNLLRIFEI